MGDNVTIDSGGVGATVSMLLTRYSVSGDSDDEQDKDEEEELVQDDDEQMMTVATLGDLNTESFCERVLSCLKLVVSDLHVRVKSDEIRMLVMLRMNREFMEYMRSTYPNTLLSEFKTADEYVCVHVGVHALDDDEDDE